MVKLLFFFIQETRSLHITFTLFPSGISWIIGIVLSWYFALFSTYFRILCYVPFFFSLATFERSSHQRCPIKSVLKNFAKLTRKYPCHSWPETLLTKRLGHKYFLQFLGNFLENLFIENFARCLLYRFYLKHQFFFLLTCTLFIYWSFTLLCICFCPTYGLITFLQIVLILTYLYFMFADWINCYLVFIFESMSWT